jgi:hypothetical protein
MFGSWLAFSTMLERRTSPAERYFVFRRHDEHEVLDGEHTESLTLANGRAAASPPKLAVTAHVSFVFEILECHSDAPAPKGD